MKLLTIGEFARASRLSAKALRLYGELGLLRPARVDSWTGYRYYEPEQLDQARLVAWLRRIGMPLAAIGPLVAMPSAEAAAGVAAFLRQSESDFAERKGLAEFLIAFLSQGENAMPEASTSPQSPAPSPPLSPPLSPPPAPPAAAPPLAIRYAAASHAGLVRDRNQDAGYAGPRLIAVADGFGTAGDRASAAAISALRQLELAPAGSAGPAPADLLNVLSDAVAAASASVRSLAEPDPSLADSGTTLTALLWTGSSQLALVHIGDTRAYLFRDGGLFQITHDDSVVQSMIDAGRLSPEEAASHPQRSLLLRALGAIAGMPVPRPLLSLRDARAGDRYLLCSDGLTSVVPAAMIRQTLADGALSPGGAVTRLITLANNAGGPDNIACAIADITAAGG